MSDILIKKLKGIKDEIEKLQSEYNDIVNLMGYDLHLCATCKGTKYYERFTGRNCNGSHFETKKCNMCVDGYGLKKIQKEE